VQKGPRGGDSWLLKSLAREWDAWEIPPLRFAPVGMTALGDAPVGMTALGDAPVGMIYGGGGGVLDDI
jgi:hypothetical protein